MQTNPRRLKLDTILITITNLKRLKLDSFLIATLFLASGIILLTASVVTNSQTLGFIGLGLTFWGAIFLLIAPEKLVEGSYLTTSTLSTYMTLDRMLNDFKLKNEAFYIPSYSRDIELPEYIKGLKEMVAFIPAEQDTTQMPAIEDLAKSKFQTKNPKGFLITPPGIGILDKIEKKRNTDLTKISFSERNETLTKLLSELCLTKEIKLVSNENDITIEISDSLYKNLYSQKYDLKSINLIGCPLVSAAACAVAKSSGKPTMIQNIKTTPDGKTTIATFKIIQ